MKEQFRVQVLNKYKDGTSLWDFWGSVGICRTIELAEQEKRRGESMYPDHEFRIVSRNVSEWKKVGEGK